METDSSQTCQFWRQARVRVFLGGFAKIMIQSEGAFFFLPFLLISHFLFSP